MRLYEIEAGSPLDVHRFGEQVEKELGLEAFDLYTKNGDISLRLIVIPKERRKEGLGSQAMQRLAAYADQHHLRIVLSPATRDDNRGTTSRARLIRFYKRFGFRENRGRSKDFSVSDAMIRYPK